MLAAAANCTFRQLLGEQHPDTLRAMHNLALTLKAQGDLAHGTERGSQGPVQK